MAAAITGTVVVIAVVVVTAITAGVEVTAFLAIAAGRRDVVTAASRASKGSIIERARLKVEG